MNKCKKLKPNGIKGETTATIKIIKRANLLAASQAWSSWRGIRCLRLERNRK